MNIFRKYLVLLVTALFIIFFCPIVSMSLEKGGSTQSGQQKEVISGSTKSAPYAKANPEIVYVSKAYVDAAIAQARIDEEKESLSNREKYFDLLTKVLAIFLAGFSLLVTLVLAVAGFLGYRELSSIKKRVDEDFDAYKQHVNEHITEQLSGVRVQQVINQTIETTFGQPTNKVLDRLSRLERHAQDLTDAVRGDYAPPDLQLEEPVETPEETPNTFDEDENR